MPMAFLPRGADLARWPGRRRVAAPAALAACLLLMSGGAFAQSFQQAFAAAQKADAQYVAAIANVTNRRLQGDEARAAFYPSASVNYSQADLGISGTPVYGVTVTQPLLSYDRYLTRQQVAPIGVLADAEQRQARVELSLRVFKAMADIVRNREAIRATSVQIEGLETQLRRAQRLRELGQGTITEVSDFAVRLAVAQANRLSQQSALDAAMRSFTLVTGLQADSARIDVSDAADALKASEDEAFVSRVRDTAGPVVAARKGVELQEIAAKRVLAQYLPQVVAVAGSGRRAGASGSYTDTRVGLSVTAPLGASPFYANQRALNDLERLREQLRFAQDTASNEARRLIASARSLDTEVAIRRHAVDAARLALEANIRSYEGGVKSNIDVVLSYQNVADTQTALANSQVSRVEALLNLRLLDPDQPL